jgi:hypothetical protein
MQKEACEHHQRPPLVATVKQPDHANSGAVINGCGQAVPLSSAPERLAVQPAHVTDIELSPLSELLGG